ncbi:MAG: FtsQ-type POTRA domain-containing protein [Oscillospiraceae bacterium]|nr:FtsQ-type POTRA domain-containing protein [Oscillospiraceae bacterium]
MFKKHANKNIRKNLSRNPAQRSQSRNVNVRNQSGPAPKTNIPAGRPVRNNTQRPAQNTVRQPSSPYNKKTDKELSRVINEKTPVRKRRNYRGGNYILYYLFALIVIVIVMIILSNTVLFRCTEIEVTGNISYRPEQIIAGSGLKTGDNLLHTDTDAAAKNVVDICLFVDEAEVRKSFPTKFIISVKEAEVCFCVSENGKNAAVSRGGRVIKYLENADGVIVLKGFEPESTEIGAWLTSQNETKTSLPWEMLELMEEAKLTGITEIDITDRYSPKVTIDGRILLNLGGTSQLESKFIVAKALIDTEIAANDSVIISLSNPEQPAVRPNNGNYAQNPIDDIPNNTEENSQGDNVENSSHE